MMLDSASAASDQPTLREAIRELRRSSAVVVRFLVEALRASREPGTALGKAWGPEPAAREFARALARNTELLRERRGEVLRDSLTRHRVAERLGVSDQAVSAMLERGALVGLREGREWRIPAWQLDPETTRGVLPGIEQLARRFPGGVVALSRWVVRPHPDLDGRAPRDALSRGEVERVTRLLVVD